MNTTEAGQIKNDFEGIDADAIEKQLSAIRRQTRADSQKPDDIQTSDTRACVLNLIVCLSAANETEASYSVLDEVQQSNPGRFFVLVVNRDAEVPRLETKLNVRCRRLDSGRTVVCAEQITLHVDGSAVDSSASAIAPLLMPDVPVYLLWSDPPDSDDKLWKQLTSMADRVIVDSSTFDKPAADLRFLARLIGERKPVLKLTDLNWSGLTAWRSLIASFWDVPSYRAGLEEIDDIAITYHAPQCENLQLLARPVLLAGWMASRLGWEVEDTQYLEGSITARLNSSGKQINLVIRPAEHGPACKGLVTSVCLTRTENALSFEVRLSHDAQRLSTEARVADAVTAGRTISYEIPSGGQRINSELAMQNRDTVFEASLISAAALVGTGDNG